MSALELFDREWAKASASVQGTAWVDLHFLHRDISLQFCAARAEIQGKSFARSLAQLRRYQYDRSSPR
jgi:hypothetical protein